MTRFSYFPDIGWHMSIMWHIHQHPVRFLCGAFLGTALILGYVVYIIEDRQEDCDGPLSAGIVDSGAACSPQVVRSYEDAVWLIICTMFQVRSPPL